MSLQAKNITVQIGVSTLVNDVSVDIIPGEIVAVVGPNGAGKSTLLKVLTGEMQPSQGTVTINDVGIDKWRKRDLAKIRAVLPQSSDLTFGFTVLQVVLMGRTPHVKGQESNRDYAIVHEAMCLTRIEHLADRIYTTLSGGEQQRVQLARVLTQIWQSEATRYLLLDEPTNNLDLSHQHTTLVMAKQFAKQGVGVFAVLHDLNLAAQYSDRILVMKDGQCVVEGTPTTVITPDIIHSTFDLTVMVQTHPCYACPLIIPVPDGMMLEAVNL